MAMHQYVIGTIVALSMIGACFAADAGLDQLAKSVVVTTQANDHGSFINDHFAKDIAAKLTQPADSESMEGVDFDVFTYSQDPDYAQIRKTIKSEVKQSDDSTGVILVTFNQYDYETTAEYRLKKSGDHWLIEDVVYPDETSLRAELGLK